ncbi:polysaccharide lyase family 14 protein [Flagelloscypha sp. PMI_526]|nr:polysaccharide lyase family 14 protein [Flagelloscypha sp. PMI_526]
MIVILLFAALRVAYAGPSPSELASSLSLTTSTTFPFPSATLSATDAQTHLTSQWNLAKNRIQDGEENLAFVKDPFDSSSSWSFSHDTGGAQFQNVWDSSANFQSMLITYELGFPSKFDWVKGIYYISQRTVPTLHGCSGGSQPHGDDCFSTRLMWRASGSGEVYAYMPTPNNICSSKSISCNDDFGVSISRGSVHGIRITLFADIANGQIQLYFNDVLALKQTDLQLRSSTSLTANGLFFSTFFGGSDSSWATPDTTFTYYRNISMWGSNQASTLSGQKVKNGGESLSPLHSSIVIGAALALGLSNIVFG